MQEPNPDLIELHFTPVRNDYVQAVRTFAFRDGRTWVSMGLFALISLFALWNVVTRGAPGVPFVPFLLALPAGLLYVFVWIPSRVGRQVNKDETLTCDSMWQLDDEQIRIDTCFVDAKLPWSTFERVVETKDAYLFISTGSRRRLQLVPKRAFVSEQQEQAFCGLLHKHLPGLK